MVVVDNIFLSDDVIEEVFVCDLEKCKGACCVEGDAGAPLAATELVWIEQNFEKIKPYLPQHSIQVIEQEGFGVIDAEGDLCTPTYNNQECVYGSYNAKGIFQCAFETAYKEGKTDFKKPISCHLYPIRVTKLADSEALNYHRWHICSPACSLGKSLQVPVYQFLKEPLIRKYGQAWYEKLEELVQT